MPQLMKSGSSVFKVGNNVFRYNSQATFGSMLNSVTTAQGLLNSPLGIAIDYPTTAFPNGRIFVVNYGNNSVSILNYLNPTSGTTTIITTAQGAFSGPTGIAIDYPSTSFPNGRIFVTNYAASTVSILNYMTPTAGSPVVISSTQGSFLNSYFIAVDTPTTSFPNGRVFVTNSNSISIINYLNPTVGSPTVISPTQGSFNSPCGISIDIAGNRIFTPNSNTVSVLSYSNPTGGNATVVTTTQGGLSGCQGVSLDAANNRIFIANANTISILNYNNPTLGSPTVISQSQGMFSGIAALAVDPLNNRIFVVNRSNSTLSILSNNFT